MRSTSRQSAARLREHLSEVLGGRGGSGGSSGTGGTSRDGEDSRPSGSRRVGSRRAGGSGGDGASDADDRLTRPAGEGPVGLTVDGEPVGEGDGPAGTPGGSAATRAGGTSGGRTSSGGTSGAQLAEQLWAVVDVLDGSASLRRSLSDPGSDPDARRALARGLLAERLDERAVGVVEHAVGLRWSDPLDLADALEEAGDTALLADAEADGALADVEDELFRFSRLVAREPDLRTALSRVTPGPRREALVRDLLSSRASDATTRLVARVARAPRGRAVDVALEDLVELAAARRDELVASVRVPLALDESQRERLRSALGSLYGRDVALQVDVDPTVLGGGVVRVGDEVLDGSVSHRLEVAAQRVAPHRRRAA